MLKTRLIFFFFSFVFLGAGLTVAEEQKFAELGNFKLESGDVIENCRIGYRTFGKLNRDKSNIVIFLTWFGGNSGQIAPQLTGNIKTINTDKYFVIVIDALANGVSSSPSNSSPQPRMKFPKLTIRDMVNSQHEFLTRVMNITHIKAVTGVSMGGIQTFQWLISYPEFMDQAVPIVGTPQLAPSDLLHLVTEINAITNDPAWQNGNYTKNPGREFEYEIGALLLTTPENYNRTMTREKVLAEIEKAKNSTGGFDANDKIRQGQAMMAFDVTEKFNGSWEKAADSVKAKVLVISAKQDHAVNPAPALKFASLLKAQTLVLEGDCGHSAPGCESNLVIPAISKFLDR
jgi:homoserine O-acetyltransferase